MKCSIDGWVSVHLGKVCVQLISKYAFGFCSHFVLLLRDAPNMLVLDARFLCCEGKCVCSFYVNMHSTIPIEHHR